MLTMNQALFKDLKVLIYPDNNPTNYLCFIGGETEAQRNENFPKVIWSGRGRARMKHKRL